MKAARVWRATLSSLPCVSRTLQQPKTVQQSCDASFSLGRCGSQQVASGLTLRPRGHVASRFVPLGGMLHRQDTQGVALCGRVDHVGAAVVLPHLKTGWQYNVRRHQVWPLLATPSLSVNCDTEFVRGVIVCACVQLFCTSPTRVFRVLLAHVVVLSVNRNLARLIHLPRHQILSKVFQHQVQIPMTTFPCLS